MKEENQREIQENWLMRNTAQIYRDGITHKKLKYQRWKAAKEEEEKNNLAECEHTENDDERAHQKQHKMWSD